MNRKLQFFHSKQNLATLTLALAITSTFAFSQGANAATEVEKQDAIDAALEWLAQNQQANGKWLYGGGVEDTAVTGSALLSFLEEGYKAGNDVIFNGTNYGDVVGDGLAYLFSQAQIVPISNQPAGNPDGDGNGVGLKFVPGGDTGRDTYVTGLVVPAIASTMTPNELVMNGPLVGRTDGSGPGGAWTHKDVVQNTIDYFAFGQNDSESGNARGGWRYFANSRDSDNSTSQWPTLALLYANNFGVTAPGFVETELDFWINYIQNPDGGSGYDQNKSLVDGTLSNVSRTGALLLEMAYSDYPSSDSDLQAAIGYMNNQWPTGITSFWNGNFGHPYAMWSAYKGLEVNCGLDDTTCITNLRDQNTARGGNPAPIDLGDTWNWWEDYSEFLVGTQIGDGSWTGYGSWNNVLTTAWNVNILAATEIPDGPEDVPEPSTNVTLALLGLLGIGTMVRKNSGH